MKRALAWVGDRLLIGAFVFVSVGIVAAIADYGMTAGSGLTFGSLLNAGTHYARVLFCDGTTPTNCAAVTGGAVKVDNSAVTQPVSGTVTANAGTGTFGVSGTVTANAGTGTFNVQGTAAGNAIHTICDSGCAGSGGTSSTFGVTFPTAGLGTPAGFYDGTNMAPARVGAVSNVPAATSMLQSLAVGQYNLTPPNLTDTRYNVAQLAVDGSWKVTVVNTTTAVTTGADGLTPNAMTANTGGGSPVTSVALLFNGTTFDRQRSGGATGATMVAGAAASGATVAGNPVLQGGRAQNAEATAVTNGQAVAAAFDLVGKQIVLPFANPENFLQGNITTAMTGTTSTAVTGMGAQGAGQRVNVTSCVASNSHATQGTMILLQDGSGGATIAQFPAASAFGGATVHFNPPVRTTANTALFAANVTTGANTFLTCTGYKGA